MALNKEREFQAKGTAYAKSLRREAERCIPGIGRRPWWLRGTGSGEERRLKTISTQHEEWRETVGEFRATGDVCSRKIAEAVV